MTKFRDALHLRYCKTPPNLPTHCNGCGAKFSISHGLECKKGGLLMQLYDEIKFELQVLAANLLSATNQNSAQVVAQMLKRTKECLYHQKKVEIYLLGISGNIKLITLWTCISRILMHQSTFIGNLPHESERRRKYLQACLDQHRRFSLFVV